MVKGDCPRCGSERVEDIHIPNRGVALAPGITGYQGGDRHEARCLNCGWFSEHTYRKNKGWTLSRIAPRMKA